MNRASLISPVEDVLQQGVDLLNTLSQQEFVQRTDNGSGSPLGAHYRHVLDHFLCLIEGLRTGQINYDKRARNPLLENSRDYALLVTRGLIDEFQTLPADVLLRECKVVYSVGYDDQEPGAVTSNFAREIMFCVGHAIHHYAIVKLLCSAMSIRLPYEFGVAPSTIKHLAARSAVSA
jgi:hypothetical protein